MPALIWEDINADMDDILSLVPSEVIHSGTITPNLSGSPPDGQQPPSEDNHSGTIAPNPQEISGSPPNGQQQPPSPVGQSHGGHVSKRSNGRRVVHPYQRRGLVYHDRYQPVSIQRHQLQVRQLC